MKILDFIVYLFVKSHRLNIRNKSLAIVHGTADGKKELKCIFQRFFVFLEVVHFKHSATLAKSLTKSDVQFDFKVKNKIYSIILMIKSSFVQRFILMLIIILIKIQRYIMIFYIINDSFFKDVLVDKSIKNEKQLYQKKNMISSIDKKTKKISKLNLVKQNCDGTSFFSLYIYLLIQLECFQKFIYQRNK